MIIIRGRKTWFYLSRSSTLLLLVCLWLSVGFVLSGCPKVCECKWRDGKEVVACRDAHFIDIPRGLDPSTQVLDLRHNNLRILPKDSFVYTGLVNLQKVWLSFCNLMRVEDGAFRKLMNVVELDLSNNYLKSVPTKALMDMGGLREFRIAHNSLTIISSTAFLPTPELVQLDISHNKITVIEPRALRDLIYLEVLDISENKITTLSASEVIPLTVLRVMNLDGNNWHCDCHLKALKKWLDDYEVTPTIPPACSHPRWLMGQAWQILDPEEFVCAPQVSAAAPRVLASEGENVTLVCQVKSEVETTITWLAGDSVIQNTNESLRYFIFEVALPDYNSYISNLTMTGVVAEDQGTYRCVAENRAGYREVNLTLQVSHEVAEVRVANVEPTTYVKSGLVMGISIAAFVFIVMCSLLYCKLRSSGHSEQPEEEKPAIPQTSRSSDSDGHSMAGYHIVPTNELDDPLPQRSQTQQPWMVRRGGGNSSGGGTPRLDKNSGHHKEHSQTMNVPTSAPSSVSYVEIPKSGIGAARTTLEDRARWKDVIVHSKDILPQSSCGRSGSQVSLGSSNPYPDLLDLPRQGQDVHATGNTFPLHALNPSYCTMPRTRSKHHGDSSTAGAAGLDGPTDSMAQSSFNNTHDSSFRSSSALNLALSEAASHAYAQGHIPLRGHPLLPGAPGLESQDPQALQELIASQRGASCSGPNDQGCTQMNGQDPYRFEYHAAQLEKFLQEYRSLQQQLLMMKQSYQATHRTGSAPRLDCCSDNRLSPPQGILQPVTTNNYSNNQAFVAPPLTNVPISQPYTTTSQIPAAVPPEGYTTVSPQPFVSITQAAVQYTASPDPQRAASGNLYPDSSQCYVVASQSYAASPQSYNTDPCLSYASPPVPYAPSLPQCHPASAQSYTVPLQIITAGDMGGGGGGGGAGEGSPSVCHSSPRCSESSVSPPTVTFPPGNEQHVKPQMLNKGAPPTEPLKSILKKTTSSSSSSSSSDAAGKLHQGRQHQQQHKQQQLHHSQSKKQQMSSQWKS